MPYLHLPVQSGSDRILAAMNRQHTRGGLSAHDRDGCGKCGRISRCRRTSSSASRAKRERFRRRPWRWSNRSASRRPSPSSTAPARHAGGRRAGPGPGRSQDRNGWSGCRRCLLDQQGDFNHGMRRPHHAGAVRAAGPPRRPADRPHALASGGPCGRACSDLIGRVVEVLIDCPTAQPAASRLIAESIRRDPECRSRT